MNAALQTQVGIYSPAQLGDVRLFAIKTVDPDTRRETIGLYSNVQTGYDLIKLFVKRADRKGTTSKGYTTYLRQFALWLHDHEIYQPLFDDIQAYKDELAARGLSAGTQAQYIRATKMFFRWTAKSAIYPNVADEIHGAQVRNDVHRRDALTADEAEAVRESIDRTTLNGKRLYAMYMLGVRRGLRVVEMSRANIKDLDEKNGVMSINIWGKGHDEPDTTRALDGDTRAAIVDYLTARGAWEKSDPLFVSTSNNSKGERLAATTISLMLKRALVDAGYDSPRLTAHSLRHTAITMAIKCSGGNIDRGKDFARHVDPATTEKYNHKDVEADDAELVRIIENAYHDDGTDIQQTLIDIITSVPDEDLNELAQIIKERGLDYGRL